MTVDWKICSDCETIECVDSCAAGALKQCVRFLSVDELMKILMRDFPNRGSMISFAQSYISYLPGYSIFPGLAIMITVIAFNIFGDGLRDALDPKMKNQ